MQVSFPHRFDVGTSEPARLKSLQGPSICLYPDTGEGWVYLSLPATAGKIVVSNANFIKGSGTVASIWQVATTAHQANEFPKLHPA
jgi:hypothetical protein